MFFSFQTPFFVIPTPGPDPGRNPERKKRPNGFQLAFVFLDSGSEAGMTRRGVGMKEGGV